MLWLCGRTQDSIQIHSCPSRFSKQLPYTFLPYAYSIRRNHSQFPVTMASQHSYLPPVESVSSSCTASRLSASSYSILPVAFLPAVLIPGTKLPLRLQDPPLVAHLRSNENEQRLGVVFDLSLSSSYDSTIQTLLRRWAYERTHSGVSRMSEHDDDDSFDPDRNEHVRKGPLIGTIATFLFHHASPNSNELIITSQGTTRFCLLGPANQNDQRPFLFHIQELWDEPLPKPASWRQPQLEARFPTSILPQHIILEPWRLAKEIRHVLLQQHPHTNNIPHEPVALSFWLLDHLTTSLEECHRILQLVSVVERLRALQAVVRRQSSYFCCAGCRNPKVATDAILIVPGADRSSNNYVNPQGHVHSTITVRRARDIVRVGSPQVQDRCVLGCHFFCSQRTLLLTRLTDSRFLVGFQGIVGLSSFAPAAVII